MTVNSESFFRKISSKDKSLDEKERKIKLREDAIFNFQEELRNAQQINPEPFFQQGKQEGIQEGIQIGIQQAAESQPEQKNILGFNKGGLVPNKGAYFEASIGREDARDLKSNVVVDSFFDTGKGRSSDSYEIKSSDGKVLFSHKSDMTGSAMSESYYDHYSNEETFDDGSGETFNRTATMTSRSLDIGVPDLIEHKDQLLGEIHKIEGFENVTIQDVLQGKTGLDDNTLFNILANSDASYATAAKKDAATKADLEARGIKPGEGFSTYGKNAHLVDPLSDDVMDETSKSLRGTVGYRSGQINPASLANFSDSFEEKSQRTYDSKGLVKADAKEAKSFNDLANSINQSVNTTRVKTVIQPINTITTKTVSNPVPTPVPVPATGVKVVTRDRKKSIAHKL